MIPRRYRKLLGLVAMYAVVYLILEYFDWSYSSKRWESFLGLTEPPTPGTKRDYARVAHFIPPPRYEVVNRRQRPEPLRPTTRGQKGAIGEGEGWKRRDFQVREKMQGRELMPPMDIPEGTSYKGLVYSPEALASQRYDETELIADTNKPTPCPVHNHMTITNHSWCSHPLFPRALNRDMHDEFIELVDTLTSLLRSANVTFVMGSGTLLGSYMFHDIIPWDDDMDLWLDYNDLPKVKRLFRNQSLHEKYSLTSFWEAGYAYEYHINTLMQFPADAPDSDFYRPRPFDHTENVDDAQTNHHVFKFHRKTSPRAGSYPWRWPFIDVSYYRHDATHVWNYKPTHAAKWPRSLFFPLVKRPLGRLSLPAPWDTRRVIQWKYGPLHCAKHGWDHIREQSQEKFKWIHCSQLYPYIPVVWPGPRRDGRQVESLRLQNITIKTLELEGAYHPEPLDEPRKF